MARLSPMALVSCIQRVALHMCCETSRALLAVRAITCRPNHPTPPCSSGCLFCAGSSIAARKAVIQTCVSRLLLQIPVFFLPPVVGMLPPVRRLLAALPKWTLAIETLILIIGFGYGLPATIALFPQTGRIRRRALEPVFQQGDVDTNEALYYNKGL